MDNIDYDYRGELEEAPPAPFNLNHTNSLTSWPSFLHEKKESRGLLAPAKKAYHRAIDDPKMLPAFLQPFFSRERQFIYGIHKPTAKHFFNIQFETPDERGVHRRIYFHFCKENFFVGSFTGLLIGASTGFFRPADRPLGTFIVQRQLLGRPMAALARMAFSGTLITATLARKLVLRATIGGLLYDALKRNRDDKNYFNQWINAGYAGTICGLVFGIRGGLPHAWAAAALTSTAAVLSEFLPWKFADSEL